MSQLKVPRRVAIQQLGDADFDAADDDTAQLTTLEEEISIAIADMCLSKSLPHSYERKGCFNHALHNTVGDRFKKGSPRISRSLAKIQQIVTFAHKSGAFSEAMNTSFGKEITLKTDI